jgi:signal peptidase I
VDAIVRAHSYCRLTLRRKSRVINSATRRTKRVQVQFSWPVPASAAPGKWHARVACAPRRDRFARLARRSSAEPLTVLRGKTHHPGHGPIADAKDIAMASILPDPRLGLGSASSRWPGWGSVLVSATEWQVPGAAGRACGGAVTWPCGVNVYSNNWSGWPYSPSDAFGAYGSYKWQCVELIERFVNLVGWYHGLIPAPDGKASNMYQAGIATGAFVGYPNGSGYRPVPGDIVVYSGGGFGHVSIVEFDDGTQVGVLEQNVLDEDGRGTESFNGNTLEPQPGWRGFRVIGFLHAKANTNGKVSAPGGIVITANNVFDLTGPGTQYTIVRRFNEGTPVKIVCQARSNSSVNGSTIWDQLADGTYVSDDFVNTPVFDGFSPGFSQCTTTSPTPPSPRPPPPRPPPTVNREAITSYNRVAPNAPYHGFFDNAWQPFTADSNTITHIGVVVGNPTLTAGATVPYHVRVELCNTQPNPSGGCADVLAQASPSIVNYGDSYVDIGDISVTPGDTYWVQWFQPPAANGTSWVTYWWAGGSTIASSDEMEMVVKGYNNTGG